MEQAAELLDLDAPRAEAWASDVLALTAELLPEDPEPHRALVAALDARPEPEAGLALTALSAFVPVPRDEPAPWQAALGTSRCDGAWLLTSGSSRSIALRFVDRDDVRHVITVDLEPDGPEAVGEVIVGPASLLDALTEEDARITAEECEPVAAARRVAEALDRTACPHPSAVANGRLLARRLAPLVDGPVGVPVPAVEEVPPPPPRDPDDDAYALDVLHRALGGASPPAVARDDGDRDPAVQAAVEAVAQVVAPTDMTRLSPAERDAVVLLEWADWLGLVIGVVRAGPGAAMHGEALVDAINRCPEVTTTVPKADRGRIAWAFDVLTADWSSLGLVDDGRLTGFGAAVLPAALARAWGGSPE